MRNLVAVVDECDDIAAPDHVVLHRRQTLDLFLYMRNAAASVAPAHDDHRERPVAAWSAHSDRHIDLVARQHERYVRRYLRAGYRLADRVAMRCHLRRNGR